MERFLWPTFYHCQTLYQLAGPKNTGHAANAIRVLTIPLFCDVHYPA
jgi:hypothetical protein